LSSVVSVLVRGRGRLLRSCDCYCIWGDTLEVV
jgi:hypothetical protein